VGAKLTAAVAEVRDSVETALASEADAEADETKRPRASGPKTLQKVLKKAAAALKEPRWQRRPPRPVSLEDLVSGTGPKQGIYHFLLPHPEMSPFEQDKALLDLCPDGVRRLAAWRKAALAPLEKAERTRLVELSERVTQRVRRLVDDRQRVLERCRSRRGGVGARVRCCRPWEGSCRWRSRTPCARRRGPRARRMASFAR
jgi:hypothetical protein